MKRKEITVQSLTVERITFSRRRRPAVLPLRCGMCQKSANWLRLPELIDRFDIELQTLFAAFENGDLHIFIGPRGTLYVCDPSAAARFRAIAE